MPPDISKCCLGQDYYWLRIAGINKSKERMGGEKKSWKWKQYIYNLNSQEFKSSLLIRNHEVESLLKQAYFKSRCSLCETTKMSMLPVLL